MAEIRILSLDGGGLMGAFSASVLATLEQTTGRRIVAHFLKGVYAEPFRSA